MCGGVDGLAEGDGNAGSTSQAATRSISLVQTQQYKTSTNRSKPEDTNLYILKFSLVAVGTAESEISCNETMIVVKAINTLNSIHDILS